MTHIAWPALLLLILSVALLVFLFIKSSPKGRWILAGILGMIVLVPIFLSWLVASSVQSGLSRARMIAEKRAKENGQQTSRSIEYHRGSETSLSRSSAGANLPAGTTLPFEPDVYASKESAVREVARLLAEKYRAHLRTMDTLPRTLMMTHTDSFARLEADTTPHENSLTTAAARAVKEVFAAIPISVMFRGPSSSQPAARDTDTMIVLHLDASRTPGPGDSSDQAGLVEGTIVGCAGVYSHQAKYVNKPWSDDFDRWRSSHPSAYWVMGQSEQLCASRQKAVDQAMCDAARQAAATIVAQISLWGGRKPGSSRQELELRLWLDGNLIMRVNDQLAWLQTDVFTQEFKRPYGSVWRSAMLVHVPPEKAKFLLDAYWAQADAQRTSWLRTAMSGAGLLMLIVMVYLFLNMATRGYYVWSVRLATVVLAAFGVWCIVMFVS